MLLDEPPLGSGVLPLGDLLVDRRLAQPQQLLLAKMETSAEATTSALLCSEPTSVTTATTEQVECPPVFEVGSLSVRKDMVARLPAMHIPDFKRNLRDLQRPCLKVNELKLNSSNAQNIKLCEGSLRVLNTPNVRRFSAFFSTWPESVPLSEDDLQSRFMDLVARSLSPLC